MILDINLPDGDGFSAVRGAAKADVPALFLSARDADTDRLFGLGLGADDYLTKPFLMQETAAGAAYFAAGVPGRALPVQNRHLCSWGSVCGTDAIVTLPEALALMLL